MPFNVDLPPENTDPWYSPLSAVWGSLKSFLNGLESSVSGKADSSALSSLVPNSRKVNGKALSADVSLTAADVSARASNWVPGVADVTGLSSALTGKENVLSAGSNVTIDRTDPEHPVISASGGGGGSTAWADITGKPTTFAPTIGSGAAQAVAGNDSRLTDARTPTTHSHAISDVTSLQAALDTKAPLASPAFTGTPTGIAKAHVGLGNVDNTSDAGKPVSTAQQTALDGKLAKSVTLASPPETTDPNQREVTIVGTLRSWFNEWGALRFRNPYSGWADAGVRFINGQGDNTVGNMIELEDRRTGAPTDGTKVLWGRHWSDGHLTRNGLAMADTIILTKTGTVPSNLPAGTVIVRPTT